MLSVVVPVTSDSVTVKDAVLVRLVDVRDAVLFNKPVSARQRRWSCFP